MVDKSIEHLLDISNEIGRIQWLINFYNFFVKNDLNLFLVG